MNRAGRSLRTQVKAFDTAQVTGSHEGMATYLDNTESLSRTLATMLSMDAELAATWLRHRKPSQGKRLGFRERWQLSRRIRGHGKNGADALLEAAKHVRRMKELHEDFVAASALGSGGGKHRGEERP
ncbi:hypothetical protein [Nonomuraea typhae]|uniref:hypothetical protein n=1 Tax=Nonomuraea typhae TaxID=2603600 RepID=UPI0012FCFB06|nr:hypothetical protein [Nonomuraea typhae]